jgi:two-component system chemotaxis response regulator CheB
MERKHSHVKEIRLTHPLSNCAVLESIALSVQLCYNEQNLRHVWEIQKLVMPSRVVRVLIIDDSPLVQRIISEGLAKDPNIEVCGTASDPYAGRDAIVKLRPDVLTLDVEMPKMNGVEFLRKLMPQYPIPVVMVSGLTERGQKTTLEAMAAGAVDFVAKPKGGDLSSMIDELRTKVKIASTVNVSQWKNRQFDPAGGGATGAVNKIAGQTPSRKICAIGASTGGTEALREVICGFPRNFIGTVVVQHMPAGFTKMFADRLNGLAQVVVKEAADGDMIYDGRVLIGQGGKQMEVVRMGGGWGVRCFDAPLCCGHRPSVEQMMFSVAKNVGRSAIGAMLTGMGADGANGMKAMRDAGARCIAQDEATCVVFGMPKEAYAKGGAESLVPLQKIAGTLVNMSR